MNKIPVSTIFAAVFEKRVLDPLLDVLDKKSVKFWGTEGTVKYLRAKGFSAKSVVTGFDFDGRVKSLDRRNFVAILADRSRKTHKLELKKARIEPIDLVLVDLYVPNKNNFPESMDVGGQALIRAAIKNFENVGVAFDEKSIRAVANEVDQEEGSISLKFRKKQAKAALNFIADRCDLESRMMSHIL